MQHTTRPLVCQTHHLAPHIICEPAWFRRLDTTLHKYTRLVYECCRIAACELISHRLDDGVLCDGGSWDSGGSIHDLGWP
jgi:hypothetical protein